MAGNPSWVKGMPSPNPSGKTRVVGEPLHVADVIPRATIQDLRNANIRWPANATAVTIVQELDDDRRYAVLELALAPVDATFRVVRVLERSHHRDLAQDAAAKACRHMWPRPKP